MADKLSWTDLRRVLASRADVSEQKAGAFLNAIQSQLVEALKSEKQVKINGLGTFKVQAVAPRKSVNVNTGEEIIIEGYNKLVFAPESGVKELIEKGEMTKMESPETNDQPKEIDPLKKLGAQAEEIVDILGDLGQSPLPLSDPEQESVVEPVSEPEPIVVPEPEPEIIVQKPKKKSHFLRDTLICIVILLMLLLVGYFFLRQQIGDILQSLIQPNETEVVADTTENVMPVEEEQIEVAEEASQDVELGEATENEDIDNIPDGRIPKEQIMAEWMEASRSTSPAESKYPELITTEPMHEASRLTWMAKRYYGAKIYWPYLFDANRDVISDANRIDVGTPIRVPKLTTLQLDTTNAETMATLEKLREEALGGGE
jgi:nucleoid DNA-binding protein